MFPFSTNAVDDRCARPTCGCTLVARSERLRCVDEGFCGGQDAVVQGPKVVPAFEEQDEAALGRRVADPVGHVGEILGCERHRRERIVAMAVISGRYQDPVGVESFQRPADHPIEGALVDVAGGPGREGDVEVRGV